MLLLTADFFKINFKIFFNKNLSGKLSDCQTIWIQICCPDLSPNCLPSYQQTAKVAANEKRVKVIFKLHVNFMI